ncbi:LytR family transcriptional regulator [Geodermatophilus sp. DF01-2]|uniref:LCP family protein n=1 Tax=Geodermatophilus sp. DF01-2 TaxID=2559610 RepID=UPI0010733844|nr:LCP family protein [Geodermatophilus sp. DF01_2]TFV64691.1 LytR family transcriptional regulator [Geodermatophilus sp. DF01_2]
MITDRYAATDERGAPHGGEDPVLPGRHGALRRVLVGLGVLGLVLAVLVGGALWFLTDRYAGNIDRVSDVFADLDAEARPAPATPAQEAGAQPVTFLLVGSDTRATAEKGIADGGRSDAIMIARLSADRQHAQLISVPRDSWVDIPGHGTGKINAAYAFGGPALLVRTVEQLTDVRIDHYVAIDFAGIVQVTDDLGGVDVVVAETTSWGPYTFQAGVNHLDGDEARWYLGQRYDLPGGDFDRVRRQQQYLQAMFTKLFSSDTFSDPARLDAALRSVTSAVAVDDRLGNAEMLSLAYSLRSLTPDDVDFFTAPTLGTGTEGAASVVYLDDVACERMWTYLRSDSLSQNAEEFQDQALPEIPR